MYQDCCTIVASSFCISPHSQLEQKSLALNGAGDSVFIPINENNAHWYSAYIDFQNKSIQIYDSWGDTCLMNQQKLVLLRKNSGLMLVSTIFILTAYDTSWCLAIKIGFNVAYGIACPYKGSGGTVEEYSVNTMDVWSPCEGAFWKMLFHTYLIMSYRYPSRTMVMIVACTCYGTYNMWFTSVRYKGTNVPLIAWDSWITWWGNVWV